MITYNWTFPQFVIEPDVSGMTNVVTAMFWMCTGVDTDTGHTALESGRVQLTSPNPEQFVPFEEITEPMALGWLSAYISMPATEQRIAARIRSMQQPIQPVNPPFVQSSL